MGTQLPAMTDYYNFTDVNSTYGEDTHIDSPPYETWQKLLIGLPCSIITVGAVFGNLLVWIAVVIVKKLHSQPSNLLILSLASSDLLVGLLIMPLALMYELTGEWLVGRELCDMWTTFDVLLCTSSILTLCAISIDRYYAITRPFSYPTLCRPRRMFMMIAIVWGVSAIIGFAPLFGWRSKETKNHCTISEDLGYQIYATVGAFYLPLGIMIVLYGKIFLISYRIAQSERKSRPSVAQQIPAAAVNYTAPKADIVANGANGSVNGDASHKTEKCPNPDQQVRAMSTSAAVRVTAAPPNPSQGGNNQSSKAIKTLGVIMGVFIACWLPFFIVAITGPMCPSCIVPNWLRFCFTWLGYLNSFLNPIIYAKFNRDFRTPFKMILTGRCRDINTKLRRERFHEAFGDTSSNLGRMSVAGTREALLSKR